MKTTRLLKIAIPICLLATQSLLPRTLAADIANTCNTDEKNTSCAAAPRNTLDFNPNWRFTKSDPTAATPATNPADSKYDDTGSAWTTISAPHTFNDTDTFDNWSLPGHRGESEQWSGRTWYRKTFATPADWKGKKIFVEFEAVRQIAEVYLNGVKLGTAKSGFSPFGFDLTSYLKNDGTPNVLAVMCDNRFMKDPEVEKAKKPEAGQDRTGSLQSMLGDMERAMPENIEDLQANQIPWNNPHWHPAHGGIYRNVRVIVTDPLHITLPLYSFLETEGPYACATEISAKSAHINIDIPLRNERLAGEDVVVRAEIFDDSNHSILRADATTFLAPGASTKINLRGAIANPRLWEPDYPHIYRVVCSLLDPGTGKEIDSMQIPLGIRTARWTPDEGFFINGKHVKLHGWGQKPTDEWPGLGSALPDNLHLYTLELMQAAGGNFVRWGHAAAGPAQIQAGDALGIIALQPGVDGEMDTTGAAWKLRAATFRDVIIYFRNNPSILIWEGGNQKVTREHAAELRGYMDKYDPSGGRAYTHRRADEVTAEFMDICEGTEGGREIARLPVIEGEYDREESPRRVWDDQSPPTFGYKAVPGKTQAYRLNSEQFAVNEISQYLKKIGPKSHSGGANWIFTDSTSGGRVETEVARASGEMDGVRLPKEAYYVCQVMWRHDPLVHIIGHWTYPAGTKKNIYVVANAGTDDVELILNEKSLGHAKAEQTFLFTFSDIAWQPGTLEAIAIHNGKELAKTSIHTAGPAVALRLSDPRHNPEDGNILADGSSVMLVDVEAIDAQGNLCPTWQGRVDFQVTGPAIWRGGYNSGKIDSINNTWLDLECGINRVALRSTLVPGKVTISAKASGLQSAELSFDVREPKTDKNGFASGEPTIPLLTKMHAGKMPDWSAIPSLATPQPPLVKETAKGEKMAGHYTKSYSYSGPSSAIVHLDTDAQPGKNAYGDKDSPLPADLPVSLAGADWIQVANADSLYSAVDFVELSVPAGVQITIAHDDRLTRPAWLTTQFKETKQKIIILGQNMTLFTRTAKNTESVTLGDNTESKNVMRPNMYLVFTGPAPKKSANKK